MMSIKICRIAFVLCFIAYLAFSLLAVVFSQLAPWKGVLFGVIAVGFLALYYLGSTVNEAVRRSRFRRRFPRRERTEAAQ